MDDQGHDVEQTPNKAGRPTKKNKYDVERQTIIEKLDEIIGISDSNRSFYFYDLDNNIEKQNQIFALQDEIKRFFKAGNWNIFTKDLKTRKYLSLLKSVYRDMGYTFIPITKSIKMDGKPRRCAGYQLNK